jgi:hypothetical protein
MIVGLPSCMHGQLELVQFDYTVWCISDQLAHLIIMFDSDLQALEYVKLRM